MTVKDTVTKSLLEYPTLFLNSLDVYDHLFCTIGNGYDWKDGELSDIYSKNNRVLSLKQAILKIIDREVKASHIINDIEYYVDKKDIEQEASLFKKDKNEYLKTEIEKSVKLNTSLIKEELEDCIKLIFDVDFRYKDFNPYTSETKRYKALKTMRYKRWYANTDNKPFWKWHIYPTMSIEHSFLCNFPDDIRADWAIAIDRMCWFLNSNLKDVVSQNYNENGIQEKNILDCIEKSSGKLKEIILRHFILDDEWFKLWTKRNKKQSYLSNKSI